MLAQPFTPVKQLGVTELIGANEQIDQNDYGAAVEAAIGTAARPVSGELLHFTFYARETGSGAVIPAAGTLYVFDADPSIAAGDTAMSAAARLTVIAQVKVEASDWKADAAGASATIFTKPVAFHAVSSLWFAWFHDHATSLNDGAGDDEILEFDAWYRRDS